MPNAIKYSTGSETLALKKGNFFIGTGDVGKGPSDTTGFYQGISPSSGGYVIYMNKSGAPGDLSYHNAPTDAELISFTNSLAGQSYTTVNECLVYFAGQTDKVCVNRDYEGIVTDGLVLNLDAGFTPSYPRSGTTWGDISLSGNNGTLTNGPTFSGGSIVLDGVNDYVDLSTATSLWSGDFSVCFWTKLNVVANQFMFSSGPYTNSVNAGTNIWFDARANTNMSVHFKRSDTNTTMIGYNFTLTTSYQNINQYVVTYISSSRLLSVYQNSNLIGNYTILSVALTNNFPNGWRIGNAEGSYNVNGNVYTFKVYNKSLTQSEISQNYNAQKGRFGL